MMEILARVTSAPRATALSPQLQISASPAIPRRALGRILVHPKYAQTASALSILLHATITTLARMTTVMELPDRLCA